MWDAGKPLRLIVEFNGAMVSFACYRRGGTVTSTLYITHTFLFVCFAQSVMDFPFPYFWQMQQIIKPCKTLLACRFCRAVMYCEDVTLPHVRLSECLLPNELANIMDLSRNAVPKVSISRDSDEP